MALPLSPGTWNIDPTHSTVEFVVRHLGISKVRGRFDTFDGNLVIGNDLASTKTAVTVDLSSVNTNNADRDGHLRSGDFFNAETHPTMSFESTGIRETGEGTYALDGRLTILDVTRPLTLDVEFNGTETNPFSQGTAAGFSAKGQISRGDFGISWNVPAGMGNVVVSDKVVIEIEAEFVPAV
jgi:polyisoprenoid-binding protein YceI